MAISSHQGLHSCEGMGNKSRSKRHTTGLQLRCVENLTVGHLAVVPESRVAAAQEKSSVVCHMYTVVASVVTIHIALLHVV
eukprot:COSAG02_NODE_707_length_18254_cov_20.685872_14_plen_81_part_00